MNHSLRTIPRIFPWTVPITPFRPHVTNPATQSSNPPDCVLSAVVHTLPTQRDFSSIFPFTFTMVSETLAEKAVANVLNECRKCGSEPPAVITSNGTMGNGATDNPYDAVNLPETTTQPGIEPPSGQKGAGTAEDPYDQGNAPGTNS